MDYLMRRNIQPKPVKGEKLLELFLVTIGSLTRTGFYAGNNGNEKTTQNTLDQTVQTEQAKLQEYYIFFRRKR